MKNEANLTSFKIFCAHNHLGFIFQYLLGIILAVIVLYEFSVLFETTLALLFSALVAILHAFSRPVVNEHYLLHPGQCKVPPMVHSNQSFMDVEEDEVTFSKDSTVSQFYSQNFKNTKSIKRRSTSQW